MNFFSQVSLFPPKWAHYIVFNVAGRAVDFKRWREFAQSGAWQRDKPWSRWRSYFADAAAAEDNRFNSSYVKKIREAFPLSSLRPSPSTRENHRSSGGVNPNNTAARCSSTIAFGP
jgi:hypothetical protein